VRLNNLNAPVLSVLILTHFTHEERLPGTCWMGVYMWLRVWKWCGRHR